MSFLKNHFRTWALKGVTQNTQAGQYDENGQFVFDQLLSLGSYEWNNLQAIRTGKSTHFYKVMYKLLGRLAQAELSRDFPSDFEKFTQKPDLHPIFLAFTKKRGEIYEALQTFKGKNEADIQQWLIYNKKLIANFLKDLDAIYAHRTTSAKVKDVLWELADALVVVLAAVGLAAIVIQLAGVGIFAGAFGHLVGPTATAMLGKTAAVSFAATGLFKVLYSEKRQIKAAIEEDLRHGIQTQASLTATA
jgi:hypothetical protein